MNAPRDEKHLLFANCLSLSLMKYPMRLTSARLLHNIFSKLAASGHQPLGGIGRARCCGRPVWRTAQNRLDAFYSFGACLSVAS